MGVWCVVMQGVRQNPSPKCSPEPPSQEFSRVPVLFQNRTDQQCQYRWLRVLNPDLVKGPWTKEEDQKVTPRTGPSTRGGGGGVWVSPTPGGQGSEAALQVG